MKKLLSLLLSLALLLCCAVPAFAEEDEAPVPVETEVTVAETAAGALGVENPTYAVVIERVCALFGLELPEIGMLLSAEQPPAELAEELFRLLFGGNGASQGNPISPDSHEAETVADGKAYSVEKRVSYYDKNGSKEYTLILKAYFVNVAGAPTCIRAEADYTVENPGRWQIEPAEPVIGQGSAACAFTVTRLFTGVPVKTDTVTLKVGGKPTDTPLTGYVGGDLDYDGKITAADARKALRIAVELEPADADLRKRADVDCDGKITAADARHILRAAVL